jgi:hypothetical protein
MCRQQRSRALPDAGHERFLIGQCISSGLVDDLLKPLHLG